jgi:hypothetical protein
MVVLWEVLAEGGLVRTLEQRLYSREEFVKSDSHYLVGVAFFCSQCNYDLLISRFAACGHCAYSRGMSKERVFFE